MLKHGVLRSMCTTLGDLSCTLEIPTLLPFSIGDDVTTALSQSRKAFLSIEIFIVYPSMMGHHIKQLPLWAGLSGSLSDLHSVPDDDNEGKDKEGNDNEDKNDIVKPARLSFRLVFGFDLTNSTKVQILRRQCCLKQHWMKMTKIATMKWFNDISYSLQNRIS